MTTGGQRSGESEFSAATGPQPGRLGTGNDGLEPAARPPSAAQSIDSTYNAFGEVLTETGLAYTYDQNGNRLTISYPGSLLATYTYDRMNRPTRLQIREGAGSIVEVVKNSPLPAYRAFGPLASLRFNSTTNRDEARGHDFRYAPTSIAVSGSLFNWSYATDAGGNVTGITQTQPAAVSRSFDYQDWQDYLTFAQGPWGGDGLHLRPHRQSPVGDSRATGSAALLVPSERQFQPGQHRANPVDLPAIRCHSVLLGTRLRHG